MTICVLFHFNIVSLLCTLTLPQPTASKALNPVPRYDIQPMAIPSISVLPQLTRMKKIEIQPISYGVKTRLNLIEFILLNIDFNYSDIVPSHHGLVFNMPNI
jgi:hypothetical protein